MGLMVIDGRVFVSFSFVVSLISIPHISFYINKLHPESDILIKAKTSVSVLEYDIFDTGNCDNDRHLPKTSESIGIIHSVFLLVIQLLCILWLFKSNSLNVIVHT